MTNQSSPVTADTVKWLREYAERKRFEDGTMYHAGLMLIAAADEIERLRRHAQCAPSHMEQTAAGVINWKMEVERLNRLLVDAQNRVERLKLTQRELFDNAQRAGIGEFATAILHGDDEHRGWLLEAARAFEAGEPLPAVRGSGAAQCAPMLDALQTARQAIEYSLDMGGTDPSGVLLQALNKCDRALSPVTSTNRCTCECVTDDYGAPTIKICPACSVTSTDSDELAEWKQAASVEAGLRREFLARAETAEAALRLHAGNVMSLSNELDEWRDRALAAEEALALTRPDSHTSENTEDRQS